MSKTTAIEWTDATWSPWEGCTKVGPGCDHCYAEAMNNWLRKIDATNALQEIDWVIVGGESGPKARPMSIQWARQLRDQCAAVETPFLFKQWGEWSPAGARQSGEPGRFAFGDYEHDPAVFYQVDGYPRQFDKFGARCTLERVGKKAAGRLLDGVQHDGFPEVQS